MRLCRKLFRPVAGSLIVLVTAVCAPAEIFNHFFPIPPGGASCFTYVLQGNQTSNINTGETSTDSLVNPFAYNGGTSCVNVSYNSSCNVTTITICGTTPIEPGQVFNYPPGSSGGNGLPHIGLDGTGGTFNMLAGYWSNPPNACSSSSGSSGPGTESPGVTGSSPISSLSLAAPARSAQPKGLAMECVEVPTTPGTSPTMPVVGLTTTQTVGANVVYYTLYVNTTDANGNQAGGWFQQAYTAGTTPSFQITNNTTESVTINTVGFILNDSQRPLDDLNYGGSGMAPPGNPGSLFSTPRVSMSGTVIAAGASVSAPVQ